MKKPQTKFKKPNRKPAERFEPVTYTKQFDTFKDGIDELKMMYPLFNEIITLNGEYDPLTPADAMACMTQTFMDNLPDVNENENLFWAINASATRCVIKTNHKISFGWKYHYNTKADQKVYDVEFTITLLGPADKILSASLKNGWTVVGK